MGYLDGEMSKKSEGMIWFYDWNMMIIAPLDCSLGSYNDHVKSGLFNHCYLRPFQGHYGRHKNDGRIVTSKRNLTVIYIIIETAFQPYLYCLASISINEARPGQYNLYFFPVMPRRNKDEREVDHFSAHLLCNNGAIELDKSRFHAKIRLENERYPSKECELEKINKHSDQFAFEYWCKNVVYLDPCGTILGRVEPPTNKINECDEIKKSIENSRIITYTCSCPTQDGICIPGDSIMARVGLLSTKSVSERGSIKEALSDHHASHFSRVQSRIHRILNMKEIYPKWTNDYTLFFELATLPFEFDNDYWYPDLRKSSFNSL